MVGALPDADSVAIARVISGRKVSGTKQCNLPSAGGQNPVTVQARQCGATRTCQVVGIAKLAGVVGVLPIPGDRESGRPVEISLLLVKNLIEYFIDPR